MLSFLISTPIIVLALWLMARTAIRMRQLKAGWLWWGALGLVVFLGGVAGLQLGQCEVWASHTRRWVGLPLPIGFFALEGDRWTDFIPPPPVQWSNFAADVLSPILILIIPLAIIWRRREIRADKALEAALTAGRKEDGNDS